jgi:hypothetical protein
MLWDVNSFRVFHRPEGLFLFSFLLGFRSFGITFTHFFVYEAAVFAVCRPVCF